MSPTSFPIPRRIRFPAALALLAAVSGAAPIAALPPEQAIASLRLDSRLEAKLWVAEPQVVDPVAIAFDAFGVAFVAECRDYPNGGGPGGALQSSIRRLEDADGDGVPERVTAFASGLSFATGVLPWREGILVLAPPQILFLRDTDGDGRADSREVVLEGLVRGVSDSLANSLRFGLDGWVHVANGGNGGRLVSRKKPGEPLDIDGMDFAFHPDTGEIRLTGETGGGFGLVFDSWGRAFTTYNINHIQHRFLNRDQARRNPAFPAVPLTAGISDHGEMSEIFPISTPSTRPNHPEQSGHFSAAGGLGAGLSSSFPEDLQSSIFVGDVVGNLVHRDLIRTEGAAFRASRPAREAHSEFLASSDPAFRPVAFEAGPDGALYVADMQRDVIEHPDYIPAKLRDKLNLRAGEDRGRILRITPTAGLKPVKVRLGSASPAELLETLGHPDAWWRLTAQRRLLELRALDPVPELREMAARDSRAVGRLHALWTLKGLGALTVTDLQLALADGHPGVRENALVLASGLLRSGTDLHPLVIRLASDPDPRTRFCAALALGEIGTDLSAAALRDVYRADAEIPWTRRAVISSLRPGDPRLFLFRFLNETPFRFSASLGKQAILRELAELVTVQAPSRQADFSWLVENIDVALSTDSRRALLEGVYNGLQRSGGTIRISEGARSQLTRQSQGASPSELLLLWRILRGLGIPTGPSMERALAKALRGVQDSSRPVAERQDMIALAEALPPAAADPLISGWLSESEPPGVQEAAFSVLQRRDPASSAAVLVERWPSLWPSVRSKAVDFLAARREAHPVLLSAVESGRIRVGELNLDLEQRRRLLRSGDASVRTRASRFWSDEEYSNRKAAVEEWLAKLPAEGSSTNGAVLFEQLCSRCHQLAGRGKKVGPDLAGSAHRSVEDLLSNILDPNMALNPAFTAYTVERKDGESVTGLLAGQTSDAVVLLLAGAERATLPRSEIKGVRSTGLSLMPEGLEAGRTPQELRDLIAFLQAGK